MSVVLRPQVFALIVVCAIGTSAYAQKNKKPPPPPPAASGDAGPAKKPGKPKVFDFSGIDISGQNRSPQLLYFLERANEELERASLERRSFIPEMVRSIEEDKL
jgi:hypothetical protein